jgi:hypothetical protein
MPADSGAVDSHNHQPAAAMINEAGVAAAVTDAAQATAESANVPCAGDLRTDAQSHRPPTA